MLYMQYTVRRSIASLYNGLMCEWPKFVELDKIFEQTCCYKSQSECASCLLTGSVTTKGQLFFILVMPCAPLDNPEVVPETIEPFPSY